jgi:hypothetical protein
MDPEGILEPKAVAQGKEIPKGSYNHRWMSDVIHPLL